MAAKVTLPENYTLVDEDGNKVENVNTAVVTDGDVVSSLYVKANNVAEEKVEIELINKNTKNH